MNLSLFLTNNMTWNLSVFDIHYRFFLQDENI